MTELLNIVSQIDSILPQMSNFIDQFNTIIVQNSINIIDSPADAQVFTTSNCQNITSSEVQFELGLVVSVVDPPYELE